MLGKSPIEWRHFPDHCLLVPFYTHTDEIRILCGHSHIILGCVYARPFMGMEFPRTYADILRVSSAYMRTFTSLEFLRTDTENLDYIRRKSSIGVTCPENPVMECLWPYAEILRVSNIRLSADAHIDKSGVSHAQKIQ